MAGTMHLVLDTNGLLLSKRNGCFHMATKAARRMVAPHRVESIVVSAACRLSTEALLLAQQHGIPVVLLDGAGRPKARLWSATWTHSATLRRQQARFAGAANATAWCIRLFRLKLDGQLANLRWLERHRASARPRLRAAAQEVQAMAGEMAALGPLPLATARARIMGHEGAMGRAYWPLMGGFLPAPYAFTTRSRRPAADPANAMLNYGYGMLYAYVESVVLRLGLDPCFGVLHTDGHGRHGLVYDLVEPFRPWVDRMVAHLFIQRAVEPAHTEVRDNGVYLGKAGKRLLIPAFADMLRAQGGINGQRGRHGTLLLRTVRALTAAFAEDPGGGCAPDDDALHSEL